MIQSYNDAIKAVKEFQTKLREMDTAFCRKGGHPDEAWWITDQQLHHKLSQTQEALNNLIAWLEIKEKEKQNVLDK